MQEKPKTSNPSAKIAPQSRPGFIRKCYALVSFSFTDSIIVMVKKREVLMPAVMHVIQSALYIVQVGVTYILMLAVMSYNGAIFLTVCVGAGVGYLSFGWVSLYLGEKVKREQAGYCH